MPVWAFIECFAVLRQRDTKPGACNLFTILGNSKLINALLQSLKINTKQDIFKVALAAVYDGQIITCVSNWSRQAILRKIAANLTKKCIKIIKIVSCIPSMIQSIMYLRKWKYSICRVNLVLFIGLQRRKAIDTVNFKIKKGGVFREKTI